MHSRPRLVPADPDPREFPPVVFACDERPSRCDDCLVRRCPHLVARSLARIIRTLLNPQPTQENA